LRKRVELRHVRDLPGADGADKMRSALMSGNADDHQSIDRRQNDASSDRALDFFIRGDPRLFLPPGAFSAPSSQRLPPANLTKSRWNWSGTAGGDEASLLARAPARWRISPGAARGFR